MAKSVCEKKLIRSFFLCTYHTKTTTAITMAYFDTIDNDQDTPVQFLPSIYLFSLGKVKDLRERLSISTEHNDDSVVAKYGYTKDFTDMTVTLREKYAYIDNVNIQRLQHEYIDQEHIFEAETDIKLFVDNLRLKLDYENEDELIVIPQRLEKLVKQEYNFIGTKYVGRNSVLITRIKFLESELEEETSSFQNKIMLNNSKIDIIKRDTTIELLKRDSIIELLKRDSIIVKRDSIIELLKRDSIVKRDSTIALLKHENKQLKAEMKLMVMEQQFLEQKKIIERTNN